MKHSEYNANNTGFKCAKMTQKKASVKSSPIKPIIALLKYSVILFALIEIVRYGVDHI